MDTTYIDSDGNYQIDWVYFNDVIRTIGMFITILSFLFVITSIVDTPYKIFGYFIIFGMVLVVEGTIASFFKVG